MIPDAWFPPIISGLFVIAGIIVNQLIMLRQKRQSEAAATAERENTDTATIAKAKIDDGTLLRGELWHRVEMLENELRQVYTDRDTEREKSRLEIEELKRALGECAANQKATKAELGRAEGKIAALNEQIQMLILQGRKDARDNG